MGNTKSGIDDTLISSRVRMRYLSPSPIKCKNTPSNIRLNVRNLESKTFRLSPDLRTIWITKDDQYQIQNMIHQHFSSQKISGRGSQQRKPSFGM